MFSPERRDLYNNQEETMADFKHLDALLQGFVDGGLPGCAMQITQRGKTIYEGYFGDADVENKVPVTKDSLVLLLVSE